MTKKEFTATRQASRRRMSDVAPRVSPKKTSAEPGGLTTGNRAASTSRKVLRVECMALFSGIGRRSLLQVCHAKAADLFDQLGALGLRLRIVAGSFELGFPVHLLRPIDGAAKAAFRIAATASRAQTFASAAHTPKLEPLGIEPVARLRSQSRFNRLHRRIYSF